MNSSANSLIQVRQVLKNTVALLLWRLKDNAKVLIPLILCQVFTQYQLSFLMMDFLASIKPGETASIELLIKASLWTAGYSGVAFMVYADITRRYLGLPLLIQHGRQWGQYLYWIFKKSVILSLALLVVLGGGLLTLSFMLGSIGFVVSKFLMMMNVNVSTNSGPLASFLLLLTVMGFIWGVGRWLLMILPVIVDTDKGVFSALSHHAQWMKSHFAYANGLSVMAFCLFLLSNALNRLVYHQLFEFTPGVILSWDTLLGPLLLKAVLSEAFILLFLSFSAAIYQQRKAAVEKAKLHSRQA